MSLLHFMGVPIQIDLNTIAAIMTIIGYSLNDTIIIFDRIREDLRHMRKAPFKDVINHALNVTLSRTVMDGNRRWAKKYGKPIEAGHWRGAEQLDLIVRAAAELGVKALTVYSFSTENWKRSKNEVDLLMQLLEAYLINKRQTLIKEGVRLHTIGDTLRLPESIQLQLQESMRATQQCEKIDLILALNYGGRDELRRAILKMSKEVEKGKLHWEDLSEETISSYLDTAPWPDPDLLIRPSGVQRVSNFLIWQISYSEMVTTDTLWRPWY